MKTGKVSQTDAEQIAADRCKEIRYKLNSGNYSSEDEYSSLLKELKMIQKMFLKLSIDRQSTLSHPQPTHTPTPWRADMSGYLRDEEENCIATVHRMTDGTRNAELEEESKGNATFIVRAVNAHEELLEAAQFLVNWIGNVGAHDCPGVDCNRCQNPEGWNGLYKAIAKAEGK